MDNNIVAQQTNAGAAAHNTLGDFTTRDPADLSDIEHLLDRRIPEKCLANLGCQQATKHRFKIIHKVINNRIIADIRTFTRGKLTRLRVCSDVETNQHRP